MVKKFFKLSNYINKTKDILELGLNKINNNRRKQISQFQNSQFNSLTVDLTSYLSELCFLGKKFGTDKSILNTKTKYQHSYTGLYNILFLHQKDQPINIAEIGIYKNASIRMLREYFKNAHINGFENDYKLIERAKKFNLRKTNYYKIDVRDPNNIKMAFKHANRKYDIIIDDSTHEFEDQINIIQNTRQFLKGGGYLIIEDIFTKKNMYNEKNYYEKLKKIKLEFSDIVFIKCNHKYNYAGFWHNHKILCLRK